MSIHFNVDLSKVAGNNEAAKILAAKTEAGKPGFAKAVETSIQNVNQQQQEANTSIADLLTGKQQDINSVVASVARADMSFKLLVGVRNKLIEAYKETMKMQG